MNRLEREFDLLAVGRGLHVGTAQRAAFATWFGALEKAA